MNIKFVIEGDSIPAARPRFSGRRAYQPKRNVEYRKVIQAAARVAMDGREPMTDEISASIKIFRKYKRTARIFGDADNLGKAIMDGCNEIVFCDDAQIVRLVVEKYTDKARPRAEIEIWSVGAINFY